MCGIVGAVSKNTLPANVDKFLKNALVVDAVRGAHSTGVCLLSRIGTKEYWEIHKEAMCGGQFVEEKYDPATDNANVHTVIGHNRYATIGGITNATAHPFKVKNVIGVHNGTLTGDWRKDLEAPKSMEVDSNAMMHSINHRGYKKTFESMSGAVATVWTNLQTGRTFCYRNVQRPLHYAVTTGGVLIFGSEKLMLEWLIDRNKITIDNKGVRSFNVDTVYEITGGEVKILEKVETFQDSYDNNWYYSRHFGGWTKDAATHVTSGEVRSTTETPSFDDDDLPWWEVEYDDAGNFIGESSGCDDERDTDNSACSPLPIPDERVADLRAGQVLTDCEGFYPVLGGLAVPSSNDMFGMGYSTMLNSTYLPMRIPAAMTDDQLRQIGYHCQKGVWFRRNKVTAYERERGVVCEYAEMDSTVQLCDWDGTELTIEYLESNSREGYIVACENLAEWRAAMNDYQTTFKKVIRANVIDKLTARAMRNTA